jgi:nucleoside-diphosphate-sugar epimerase
MIRKNILITGAAGYIGSMLSTKLVSLNYNVTAVDILKYDKNSLSHLFGKKNFKFIKGDVRQTSCILKIIKNQNFIFPLAALVGAPLCERFKKNAIKTNLESIQNLIKHLKSGQKIIYPTTNSGYGIGEKNKFCDEKSPLKPISLYGTTKAEAEKIVLNYKDSVCFRLATVFGYSYRMRTDLLVNNFVEKAVKIKKLDLFEPYYRRNYIHISDVISAFIYTIRNFKMLRGQTYNLGLSSANLTKIALAKKIKKKIKELKIKIIKNRFDPDKRDYYVSNKKIETAGFKANVNIEEGIEELIQLFTYTNIKFKNNY